MSQALDLVDDLFASEPGPDATLASYVASLALAVNLRAGMQSGGSTVTERQMNLADGELEIVSAIVPAIADCTVERCSLPDLVLRNINVHDTELRECELDKLRIEGGGMRGFILADTHVDQLVFGGAVNMQDCLFDIELGDGGLLIEPGAEIQMYNVSLSPELMEALAHARNANPDAIKLEGCAEISEPEGEEEITPGRFFVNKLMMLCRRHGRDAYAVYSYKLRGRSRATGNTFGAALGVLQNHGAVEVVDELIKLSPEAAEQRYAGRLKEGMRPYDDVAEYWAPVVAELDGVFESG